MIDLQNAGMMIDNEKTIIIFFLQLPLNSMLRGNDVIIWLFSVCFEIFTTITLY